MSISKELALAIDFKKAPKELQDAAAAQYANENKVAKLKNQMLELAAQLELAERAAEASQKILKQELKAWNPEV